MAQPIRQCAGCRRRLAQALMRRFVREGTQPRWHPDRDRRQDGRGVYLCSPECAIRVEKNRKYPGLAAAAAESGLI